MPCHRGLVGLGVVEVLGLLGLEGKEEGLRDRVVTIEVEEAMVRDLGGT